MCSRQLSLSSVNSLLLCKHKTHHVHQFSTLPVVVSSVANCCAISQTRSYKELCGLYYASIEGSLSMVNSFEDLQFSV
jgi:hypothetical protein